jgi:hypothetical protein
MAEFDFGEDDEEENETQEEGYKEDQAETEVEAYDKLIEQYSTRHFPESNRDGALSFLTSRTGRILLAYQEALQLTRVAEDTTGFNLSELKNFAFSRISMYETVSSGLDGQKIKTLRTTIGRQEIVGGRPDIAPGVEGEKKKGIMGWLKGK